MRTILVLLGLIFATAPALGEEWTSRSGHCFEWQGLWVVERDQSGAWVGYIDSQQVGGNCVGADNSTATAEVRAVMVGEDFFARVTTGNAGSCLLHGRIHGVEVRGFTICAGAPQALAFVLRLKRL